VIFNTTEIDYSIESPFGYATRSDNKILWYAQTNSLHHRKFSNFPKNQQIWTNCLENIEFIDLIHIEDRERIQKVFNRIFQNKFVDEYYRIVHHDGKIQWVHDQAHTLIDDDGKIWGVAGIIQEITELQNKEIALLETELQFRQIAENVDIAFWVYSPDVSTCFYISPGYEKIWGQSCTSIYENPQAFLESIHPDDLERVKKSAIGENAVHMDEEYRIIRPDGQIIWVRDRAFPVYDKRGNIICMVGRSENITTTKQAEEEIYKSLQRERELSEAKTNFIATTSHEIRTPLTTIQSSLDMLQYYHHCLSEEKKHNHFQKIEQSVQRITSIVQDILLIAEGEAGQLICCKSELNIVEFCQEIITNINLRYREHRIIFTTSGDSSQIVTLDPKLINHILTNLLNNALKYSPQNQAVEFHLDLSQYHTTFRICDKGIGISDEDLPYIFSSFYRASNANSFPGTGLGLAIVKHCIDLHQGKILVNSTLGKGTTFLVKINN
jgi:PAS domain S-box-containing protein